MNRLLLDELSQATNELLPKPDHVPQLAQFRLRGTCDSNTLTPSRQEASTVLDSPNFNLAATAMLVIFDEVLDI